MFALDMNKYKKPHVEEKRLGKNPFLLNLMIRVNKIELGGQFRKPDKDGDVLPVEVEIECDIFCKVYVDSKRRLLMTALTPRSKDLLLWLIYEADNNKDWLWLNKVRYMEENRISSVNTYKSALNELIMNGFLNKTVVGDVYWINPEFFFNGNRVISFPANVIRK